MIAAANNSAPAHNLTFHSIRNQRDHLKAKSICPNSRSPSVEQAESDLTYQQIIFKLRFTTTQYTDSLKPRFSRPKMKDTRSTSIISDCNTT